MKWKKIVIASILGTTLFFGSMAMVYGEERTYQVQNGDTFWIIGQKYGISTTALIKANGATENTILYPGESLIIPNNEIVHTVQSGETYWTISQKYGVNFQELLKYNGANEYTWLSIGQKVKISNSGTVPSLQKPYITYIYHKVQQGDDFWKLSLRYGIPMYELIKANGMNEQTMLNIGDTLKIPVHHVPIKPTPASKYGEYLDWWTEAQYVIPMRATFRVIDFATGKRWMMKRTMGANHADCEPLTREDTDIMKAVWGGEFSWVRRPIVIEYNGRRIAASASSQSHDVQDITTNGFSGHMDIHFANSTRHKDGQIDWEHQRNIKIAAGIK
ncbi:LysM peptidoglycan-binding domain-containing protein [Clostridiaceae bacterium 35-E11]